MLKHNELQQVARIDTAYRELCQEHMNCLRHIRYNDKLIVGEAISLPFSVFSALP